MDTESDVRDQGPISRDFREFQKQLLDTLLETNRTVQEQAAKSALEVSRAAHEQAAKQSFELNRQYMDSLRDTHAQNTALFAKQLGNVAASGLLTKAAAGKDADVLEISTETMATAEMLYDRCESDLHYCKKEIGDRVGDSKQRPRARSSAAPEQRRPHSQAGP